MRTASAGGGTRLLLICVLLSGTTSLVYEVAWARQMSLFLGITTYAHTAVVCAFLLGLALGARLLGVRADRHARPLRLYAWLEAGIGLYAAATPWVFPRLLDFYATLAGPAGLVGAGAHAPRFLVAMGAMLLPAMLMGGTLPTLVRAVASIQPSFSAVVGRIYGVNTLGAAAGAFATGFLLLPALGVRTTILVAAATNLIIAATVLAIESGSRKGEQEPKKIEKRMAVASEVSLPRVTRAALIAGFAASGFAALVLELAWIRSLILVVGSSVYAFSATLATYLAGLGAGSLLVVRLLRNASHKVRMRWAAWLEAAVGWSALLGIAVIAFLPEAFLAGYRAGVHESFLLFQGFSFLLCASIMVVPTVLLGMLFPLIAGLWPRLPGTPGRAAGGAYATNTAGTLLGALVGGTLLLPGLGAQRTILLAAGIHTCVAVLFTVLGPAPGRRKLRYAPALAIGVLFPMLVALTPTWNQKIMTSGPLFHAEGMAKLGEKRSLEEMVADNRLLYYGEDADATVTVLEVGDQLMLGINGKTDASSRGDLATQIFLGQLPMLVHPDPVETLVIGLGSGITAGSVATHASLESLDIVEISPRVVEASRLFDEYNGKILEDPRTHLHLADARSFLLAGTRRYDVIISEPSNPWITGVANLFTMEFFELARGRLQADGIMAQWFQSYQLPTRDLRSLLHTYRQQFAHTSLWLSKAGDMIVLGSELPHHLSYKRLRTALQVPSIRADVDRVEKGEAAQIVELLLLSPDLFRSYAPDSRLNTDDRPGIEFDAARSLFANTTDANLADLIAHQRGRPMVAPVSDLIFASDDTLVAPAMGLAVRTAGTGGVNEARAQWLLTWQRQPPSQGGKVQIGVGSEQEMSWQEEQVTTFVTRSVLSSLPTQSALGARLQSLLPAQLTRFGQFELANGGLAVGAVNTSPDGHGLILGLVWSCLGEAGEVAGYTALREIPDPGEFDSRDLLLDLADRFRCTTGGGPSAAAVPG